MLKNLQTYIVFISLLCLTVFCSNEMKKKMSFTGAKHEIKLITMEPGHWHAALVQKIM